jgi:CBS domain-containing protein
MMRLLNVGSLPVVEGERVVGILTDRDIVVRGLALGFNPRTASVADVMTRNVQTCSVDDDVEDVAHQMRDLQVRRLLVVDEQERLIGIVSLGDLAMEMEDQRLAGRVLEGISEPSTSLTH